MALNESLISYLRISLSNIFLELLLLTTLLLSFKSEAFYTPIYY